MVRLKPAGSPTTPRLAMLAATPIHLRAPTVWPSLTIARSRLALLTKKPTAPSASRLLLKAFRSAYAARVITPPTPTKT